MGYNEMVKNPYENDLNINSLRNNAEKQRFSEYVLKSTDRCVAASMKEMSAEERQILIEKARAIEM